MPLLPVPMRFGLNEHYRAGISKRAIIPVPESKKVKTLGPGKLVAVLLPVNFH